MIFSWLDFGESDKQKMIKEISEIGKGSVDNLGFGIVRNHFQDIFFPGITTIQTRAKYFFICSYILRDLDKEKFKTKKEYREAIKKMEKECCEKLLKKSKEEKNNKLTSGEIIGENDDADAEGIIGSTVLQQKNWIKRTPLEIYWSGIKKFKLLNIGDNNYIDIFSRDYNDDEINTIWNIPTYFDEWMNDENISVELTYDEAVNLKEHILENASGSILAWILKNDIRFKKIVNNNTDRGIEFNYFDLISKSDIGIENEDWYEDYVYAKLLADFMYCIQMKYNAIAGVEEGKQNWEKCRKELIKYCTKEKNRMDDLIDYMEKINDGNKLYKFVESIVICINKDTKDFDDKLDQIIISREKKMKGERAYLTSNQKDKSKKMFNKIDYRCASAIRIINDIQEGLSKKNA